MKFDVLSKDNAPEGARAELGRAQAQYGFLPNLLGVMAEAPALLLGYRYLMDIFEKTSLSPAERQIVLLATSRSNACDYCMAAHSTIADMMKVPTEVTDAIRAGRPIGDAKLEALRRFTAAVVETRGLPGEAETKAFVGAGYTKAQVLEVILGVGMKTLSNYTNHVADTPLDPGFSGRKWQKLA